MPWITEAHTIPIIEERAPVEGIQPHAAAPAQEMVLVTEGAPHVLPRAPFDENHAVTALRGRQGGGNSAFVHPCV